jgi:PAS domain S-box-containing protein
MDAFASKTARSAGAAELGADGERQRIIDAVMEGVCILDGQARVTQANGTFLRITGYELDAVIGRNLCELLHGAGGEGGLAVHKCELPRGTEHLEPRDIARESLCRKDGTLLPARCWLREWQGRQGATQYVMTVQDLSELQQEKQVLERDEQRFRRMVSNAPDVAWTSDIHGHTVYISPRVQAVLGYTKEEFCAGRQLRMGFIHPADFGRVHEAYQALFKKQSSFDVEYRFRRKDGTWIWLQDRATSIYEENGVRLADGFLSDVSPRKKAETELQFQKALLEAQANCTLDGILVVDPGGRTLLRNQRFGDIFKLGEEGEENWGHEKFLRHIASLMKSREAFASAVEYLYKHPDETRRDELELNCGAFLDWYSSPVVDKTGLYYGRIWTFRDITEPRKAERELRLTQFSVDHASEAIQWLDAEGRIVYANHAACAATGRSREELPGLMIWEISPMLCKQDWQKLWERLKTEGSTTFESQLQTKLGEALHVEINANYLRFDEQEYCFSFARDISERRALESQLRQAQKLEGIGQLAAGIAHEINTPTQFVTDNLTFMQESWKSAYALLQRYRMAIREVETALPPGAVAALREAEQGCDLEFIANEVPKAIDQSLDGARRVAKIVRAMKEFSHPDAAEKTATDLNRAIESTISVARNEWKYVSDVVTEFDDSMPAVVCYPGDINQVVLNLIVNAAHAIKARVKEGEKGKITVRTRHEDDFAEISVADTGTGIPAGIQGKVFDPFFTTKDVGKGTGQGLSFSYSVVVKKHGGKIWFDTEPGTGTTFFVRLPIKAEMSGDENE